MLFSDQVSILSNWFKNWNECEQTVALFSLLKRVQRRQAKFLAQCLEHVLKDCTELVPVEREANDAVFIGQLINESRQEQVIEILLSHLPLLRPGNNEAKSRYLDLLPKVLAFAVERSEYLEESRQLLSYSLIHPAFDNDERSSLTTWMEHLDDRIHNVVPNNNPSTHAQQDESQNVNDVNHNRLWKDDPALPRSSEVPAGQTSPWQMSENGVRADNGLSLSPGHRRDDTDAHHADNATAPSESAVAEYDFNPWLKSLRLHKYKDLFNSMTYEEVMQLTEEKLTRKNVTKGARDKILLNIKRLHERFEKLQSLEKEILRGGSIRNALNDMKTMICTPIIKYDPPTENPMSSAQDPTPAQAREITTAGSLQGTASTQPGTATEIQPGDIPGQFTKVLGKACTQLLISKFDKDNITLYMQLLEKCMQHQAFTSQQKKRLSTWKSQLNKAYRSLPKNQTSPSQRNAIGSSYPNKRVSGRSLPTIGARMASPVAPSQASGPLAMFPQQVLRPNWYGGGYGSNTHPTPHTVQIPTDAARRTASLDPSLVQRPAGYPQTHHSESGSATTNRPIVGDADISMRLDSLSLSVAEQALPD